MKAKEKDGINIEFTCGTLEDLFDHIQDLFELDEQQKEDGRLFRELAELFDKQSIRGQQVTIESLLEKYTRNLSSSIKEELKEDANDKADC